MVLSGEYLFDLNGQKCQRKPVFSLVRFSL